MGDVISLHPEVTALEVSVELAALCNDLGISLIQGRAILRYRAEASPNKRARIDELIAEPQHAAAVKAETREKYREAYRRMARNEQPPAPAPCVFHDLITVEGGALVCACGISLKRVPGHADHIATRIGPAEAAALIAKASR